MPAVRHPNSLALALTVLVGVIWASGCGDGATEPPAPTPDPPRPTTVAVAPATAELAALGATVQLTVEVLDQNGQAMVGAAVTWASSATAVATTDANGLVTAVGNGTATISATASAASGSAAVTVAQVVSAVAVSADADTLVVGDTLRFTADAADANGHPVDGAGVQWASSDTAVAVVDDSGLATGVSAGDAQITAIASGVAGGAALTVVAPVPTTVTVTPDTVEFTALGETAQLAAEVRDQIGRVMTAPVLWSSGDTLVAVVDSAGRVTAAGNGSATITAASGEASGNAVATVRQIVSAVDLDIDSATIVIGDALRLSAAVTDANGHAVPGAAIEWSSGAPRIATVDATGLVRGVAKGAAVIAAASGTVADSVAVRVVSALSVSFAEDPLRVVEGEEAAVGIRYRVHDLGSPAALEVSVREGDADAADYELSETRFEIPAGSGVEGTFDLTIAARADDAFAEGDEGIALALSVPDAIEAEVGGALQVVIGDAAVSPVPGISLIATRPEQVEAVQGLSYIQAQDRLRTTLTSEWHPDSQGVTMRWIGPYGPRREWIAHHPYYEFQQPAKPHPPQPAFHIEAWNVESAGSAVTHVMDLTWPAGTALELTFGGETGVACTADGCSMTDARTASTTAATAGSTNPGALGSTADPGVPVHQGDAWWTAGSDAGGMGAAHRYNFLHEGWDPSAWPPGDTLVFHLSTENWPEDAGMTPEEAKELIETMFAEWSAIPSADILWRVEGPVAGLVPGRDGKNIFWIDPGYVHGGGTWTAWFSETGRLVELDHRISPSSVRFTRQGYEHPWPYIVNELGMHPLGHTLGLDHAAAFPVARSCPGTGYDVGSTCGPVAGDLDYWRRVGGAWQLDPIMSYGVSGSINFVDERGTALRLDDKIGVSLLRPKPGWLATTGTIAGSVRTEGGRPVPHIHIWALRPIGNGRMDGVGAFADGNGDFQIEGLPPGDWFLVAHPDLDWLANPWFFYERQGEMLDEMLLYPMRARAGEATGGIAITMSRGRRTTVGTAR